MIWSANSLFFEHPDIYGISFDSRYVKKGDMFIALKGANVDGHNFVEEALKKGAVCALVDHKICENNIVVDSVLTSFLKIAELRRSIFKNQVIAITGSVGKSTFRASLVNSLKNHFNIQTPIKNYNTLIGLAYFLSQFDLNADYLAIEIGIGDKGEMEEISKLVSPNISVLTTISAAHSSSIGCLKDILFEKSRIFCNTQNHAIFCQNLWYSKFLYTLMQSLNLSHSTFPFDPNSRTFLTSLGNSLLEFLNINQPFKIEEIAGRRQMIEIQNKRHKISIIDSSYNANMSSMIEELKWFSQIQHNKKIAILGDMFDHNIRYHEILSIYCNFECLCLGEKMQHLAKTKKFNHFNSIEQLIAYLKSYLPKLNEDVIFLVKGSNCMNLNLIVEFLKSQTL